MLSEQQFNARIEQGKMEALKRRAALTPEQGQKLQELEASIPSRMERFFVGPPNAKGRQDGYLATPEEYAAWKASNG